MQKLIVILGPTASGKTALGIALAKRFGGEVVSADSRQVYRGMDIGTAKPRDTEDVPHHLIDVATPDEPFSVADWKRLALGAMDDIVRRGRVPIVVGGTGLYIQSVVDNIEIPAVPANQTLRTSLETKSDDDLIRLLRTLDPEHARRVDKKNRRRVIRALEVAILTGESFSSARRAGPPLFDVLQIGQDAPRAELYRNIDARVLHQIEEGFVDEVRRLLNNYDSVLPSFSAIGYREIGQYLRGEMTLADAIRRIQFATHAYARRQMTWFRRDKRIHWVRTSREAESLVANFLGN